MKIPGPFTLVPFENLSPDEQEYALPKSFNPAVPPADAKLWRYLTMEKFINLLTRQQLYFARADQFKDRFEGSFPQRNHQERVVYYAELMQKAHELSNKVAGFGSLPPIPVDWMGMAQEWMQDLDAQRNKARERTFITCWAQAERESTVLWENYASLQFGIALQTRVNQLQAQLSVPKSITSTLGQVKYLDYDSEFMEEGVRSGPGTGFNPLAAFFHKRHQFSEEMEVRVVLQQDLDVEPPTQMMMLPINLQALLEQVVVSPDAPEWFFQDIQQLMGRFELSVPVHRSSLHGKPLF